MITRKYHRVLNSRGVTDLKLEKNPSDLSMEDGPECAPVETEDRQVAVPAIQARKYSSVDQDRSNGDGKKWQDMGYILEVESVAFIDDSDVGCKR